jgi:hypothetical protein
VEITAPTSSAFTGVRKRLLTEDSTRGWRAVSRKENASRLRAPGSTPHEKKAKMMRRRRKSCIPLEIRDRRNALAVEDRLDRFVLRHREQQQ